jgi:hypothetical protein
MEQKRRVVEIVGPAGAGKSSLSFVLQRRDRTIRAGLSIWGLPIRLLIANGFFSLSLLPRFYRPFRRVPWNEIEHIARLNALYQFLGQEVSGSFETLVLDEGAVFCLAKLHTLGHGCIRDYYFEKWSKGVFKQWAETLDTIVWLDASDAVLAERIRTRGKQHRVKDKTDQEIYEFLAQYRTLYEQVISKLTNTNRGLNVIRFNTEQKPLERIADEVLAEVNEEQSKRGNSLLGNSNRCAGKGA